MDVKNNIKTNKKIIISVAITCVLALVIGFYSGRYYERTTFRDRMQQFRQNSQGNTNRSNSGGTTNPMGNRQFRQGTFHID